MWRENWLNYLVQRSLTQSPAGSQSPALCPRDQSVDSDTNTFIDNLGDVWKRTQSWEEWLVDNMIVLLSGGTYSWWRNGQRGISCSSAVLHGGEEKLHAPIHAMGPQTGEQLCRIGPGGPGGNRLPMSQQCPRQTGTLGAVLPADLKWWVVPSTLCRWDMEWLVQFGAALHKTDKDILWRI